MRTFFSTVLIIMVLFTVTVTGCGKKAEDTSEKKDTITIAVIPKGTTHEFWKSIHAGAEKASRETSVEIIWKGPQKEDDREQQIQVMEDFISTGVSGIVLAPLDNRSLMIPVREAKRRGIPVVIIDSGLDGKDYISFVATDNYKGGQLGAKRLAELLSRKGKIIMLRYQEGSASTMNRERGFMDEITSNHPDIEILSSNQYAGATTESAYQKSENLLNRFPDVEGIFCPNESSTFGMFRALQDAGLAGKLFFVGFDSSEKLVRALEAGEIHGLVLQNPFRMGELGVKTIVNYLKNKTVPEHIDTGVTLVTKDIMNDTDIKQLLTPDLSKYLE